MNHANIVVSIVLKIRSNLKTYTSVKLAAYSHFAWDSPNKPPNVKSNPMSPATEFNGLHM